MRSPCSLLSPSLTDLTIIDCVVPWKTATEFLLTLQSLPLLRTLHIIETEHPLDLSDDRRPVLSNIALPVVMRHLKHLRFEGPLLCTSRVLSMLVFPVVLTMELGYHHHHLQGPTLHEVGGTVSIFDSMARSMPNNEFFSDMGLEINLLERELEFSFSVDDYLRPREAPCLKGMRQSHSWDEEDDILLPYTWVVASVFCLPFIPHITHTPIEKEVSLKITLEDYADEHLNSVHVIFSFVVVKISCLTYLRLESEAADRFIPWIVRLMYNISPAANGAPTQDIFIVPGQLRQPLLLPRLDRMKLSNCDLGCSVRRDDSGPTDILFSYLWLYLHANKIRLELSDVRVSTQMVKELERMLGVQLHVQKDCWDPVKSTCISVQSSDDDAMEELTVTVKNVDHKAMVSVPKNEVPSS